jgi:formylglycine-generating enzyme required for sulfatase activity
MPWHPALNQLRDALAELYPDVADARRVVATAGLDDRRLAFYPAAINTWQSILGEAEKQEFVEDVIAVVVTEYPRNRSLRVAVEAYRQRAGKERSPAQAPADNLSPISTSAIMPPLMAPVLANPVILELGHGVTLELVQVLAGGFLMGSADTDIRAYANEKPQHRLWLPDYLIGRYAITVVQFSAFVQAACLEITYPGATKQPDDHPICYVTWHEAMAFCDWAGHLIGRSVCLPSEAEWEKAARGTDGRIYPWGNTLDIARYNNRQTGPGDTTPVGRYGPLGDSPYGCSDMAGNVWEWTRSLDRPYPYDPDDGRENIDTGGDDLPRVVRGGSFGANVRDVRCAVRLKESPDHVSLCGFRVTVVPTSP